VSSSGIPEVMSYLNGIRVPKAFNINTFFAKVASIIFSYSSSLALGELFFVVSSSFVVLLMKHYEPIGPEGPMIHLGATIGAAVGPAKSKTLNFYGKVGWQYRNDKDKRDFITSGAAAGDLSAINLLGDYQLKFQ
jgi:chloride channel 7